jgi:hypothetical protein
MDGRPLGADAGILRWRAWDAEGRVMVPQVIPPPLAVSLRVAGIPGVPAYPTFDRVEAGTSPCAKGLPSG